MRMAQWGWGGVQAGTEAEHEAGRVSWQQRAQTPQEGREGAPGAASPKLQRWQMAQTKTVAPLTPLDMGATGRLKGDLGGLVRFKGW